MIRHAIACFVLAVFLLSLTGCGGASGLLTELVDYADTIARSADAVKATSTVIKETASPFADENFGVPASERPNLEHNFSGVIMTLKVCNRSSNTAECTFHVQLEPDQPDRTIQLRIDKVLTPDGRNVNVQEMRLGDQIAGWGRQVSGQLLSGIPSQGTLLLSGVPPQIDRIGAIQVWLDENRSLSFRNVPIE